MRKSLTPVVAASLLSADFLRLQEEIKDIETISQIGYHHLDVMDGHFVDNISFGLGILKAVKKVATLPCDVHLMINTDPSFIFRFADEGADLLSFHIEAYPEYRPILERLRRDYPKLKVGLSFNPRTSVEQIEPGILDFDFINLMSVNPGFGGQNFIPESLEKLEKLYSCIERKNLTNRVMIEVDGGVCEKNAQSLINRGASILVSGSYIYRCSNHASRQKAVENLLSSVK